LSKSDYSFITASDQIHVPDFLSYLFVRLVSHLDKCTLRLLSENERVVTFSSSLRDRLAQAQENCTAKVSISLKETNK